MQDISIFSVWRRVLIIYFPMLLTALSGILSYITGMSVSELKEENAMLRKRSMIHTAFFLLGFSIIFIAIGFGTSFIGGIFTDYKDLIRQLGGIFIIVFGLIIVGVFKPKFLMQDRKFTFKNRPSGYFGSVLIGLAFAAGWTPCTTNSSVRNWISSNKPRISNDLHDCLHTWICYPVFRTVILYYENVLD